MKKLLVFTAFLIMALAPFLLLGPTTPVRAGADSISITQSDDLTVVPGSAVSCDFGQVENSWIRRFDLDGDHGLTGEFTVSSVDFGVEVAVGTVGTQQVDVNLYTIPNADTLLFSNMTLIGFATDPAFPDQALTLVNMLVVGTVLDSTADDLVVELHIPNPPPDKTFLPGANNLGQDAPSFIAAPLCGVINPTDLALFGFDMSLVLVVNGTELADLAIDLDIKPESCPNPFNVNKKGVLSAAILGTAGLNVSDIDVSTLQLEGVSPLRSSLDDVATPYGGAISDPRDENECTTEGADGFDDLTLKFDAESIAAALGPGLGTADGYVRVLELTGNLNDGTAIVGVDVVRIIKKK